MLYDAKNGCVPVGGGMDYAAFGRGDALILIPGLGDAFKTVRGMALPFAVMYRDLAKRFRVYAFSRRRALPERFSTREMAADTAAAMDALGISAAHVAGVSLGGMIAQHLAIDSPERVRSLVLAVTLSRPNDTMRGAVSGWIEMARRGDYAGIMLDTAKKSYSAARLKRELPVYRLAAKLGGRKDFARFFTQAEACLTHDSYGRLGEIACPTLVIGGSEDAVATAEASRELAAAIPGARLFLYEGLSHGAYEEAPDFFERAAAFCQEAGSASGRR